MWKWLLRLIGLLKDDDAVTLGPDPRMVRRANEQGMYDGDRG